MVDIYFLKGSKKKDGSGETAVTFQINTKEGVRVESKGLLSKNGKHLRGASIATVMRNGKPTTISYKWSAERKS